MVVARVSFSGAVIRSPDLLVVLKCLARWSIALADGVNDRDSGVASVRAVSEIPS